MVELTFSKLVGGTYGIGAIIVAGIGLLLGLVFVFTNPLAGMGIWLASAALGAAGLLSISTSRRFLTSRVNVELSAGAISAIVGALSVVAVGVFVVSLGMGLLASGGAEAPAPGHDVSNVSLTADDTSSDAPDAKLEVTWNARAQSAVDPDPDDFTSYNAENGQKFIVVRMEATNTGDTEVDLDQRLFRVNSDGVIHDPQLLFGSANDLDVTLEPGATHQGYIVFQVPEDVATGTLLVDQDSYYDGVLAVTFEHDSDLPIEMDD